MALTCPSIADFFFAFSLFWPPCSTHYWQRLTVFLSALQIPSKVCKHLIWPVQIDPNDLYYRCRFYFRVFTNHLLQVLLFIHRWYHLLVSFGPHYWYLIGSFYLLKSMALTYLSIAASIFSISPFWPPTAPNIQQWFVGFINALQTLFLVCWYLFVSIWIDTNYLYYHYIFYFRFLLPSWLPAAPNAQWWLTVLLIGLRNSSLVCKPFVRAN